MVCPEPARVALAEAYGLEVLDDGVPVTGRVRRWSTDAGHVAVKTFDAAARERGALEAVLIAFLHASPDPAYGIQTPLVTTTGAQWADLDQQRFVVTHWEHGDQRTYDTYSAAEWSALGRCLAALHRQLEKADSVPPPLETLSSRLTRIDVDAQLARFASRGVEAVDRHLATCRELFSACYPHATRDVPPDDPQHPIHNDFNQFNYLFLPARPPMIIDWEASIGAPREFEVVRCLNHLPLQSPHLARVFLRGYLCERPLRADRMPWAVDTACLMHATKDWVVNGWIEGRPGFDKHLRGAIEMVHLLARERQRLADFFTRQVEEMS